jgi:hypothetical protein
MCVATGPFEAEADIETADHSALRLMLAYVEAECLRVGATEAARHAALAASLMPKAPASPPPQPSTPARLRNPRLH